MLVQLIAHTNDPEKNDCRGGEALLLGRTY